MKTVKLCETELRRLREDCKDCYPINITVLPPCVEVDGELVPDITTYLDEVEAECLATLATLGGDPSHSDLPLVLV